MNRHQDHNKFRQWHDSRVQQIKEGSVVIVRGGFGADAPMTVTVTEPLEPHKYAQAFSYTTPNGGDKWAYDHQIVNVVSL